MSVPRGTVADALSNLGGFDAWWDEQRQGAARRPPEFAFEYLPATQLSLTAQAAQSDPVRCGPLQFASAAPPPLVDGGVFVVRNGKETTRIAVAAAETVADLCKRVKENRTVRWGKRENIVEAVFAFVARLSVHMKPSVDTASTEREKTASVVASFSGGVVEPYLLIQPLPFR